MYQKMYCRLFNAVTDALEELERQNYGQAKERLILAQQECEELYLQETEDES
ncbi:MAG: hypothetical protein J6J83_00305 [Oscillospiraceae bacterium]|nr:hypothetical protein [Oscillospiraceae bacterium]